jgi:hypothetical protein
MVIFSPQFWQRSSIGRAVYRHRRPVSTAKSPTDVVTSARMYRLSFERGEVDRPPLTTRGGLLLIGTAVNAPLRLIAPGIAERHAIIEWRADGYHVCDLGGPTGVRVNGHPVREWRLITGDLIEIGPVELRFELVAAPRARRPVEALVLAAGVAVALLIAGEVALLAWVLAQPRSRAMKVESRRTLRPASPPATPSSLVPTVTGLVSRPPEVPATPAVLNRQLKIQKVTRKDTSHSVELRVQVQAQVPERTLDLAAAVVQVEWRLAGAAPRTDTLALPATWGNFSAKTLVAKFAGPPPMVQGYVVRTFYQQKLQDVRAEPATLLTPAPAPPQT